MSLSGLGVKGEKQKTNKQTFLEIHNYTSCIFWVQFHTKNMVQKSPIKKKEDGNCFRQQKSLGHLTQAPQYFHRG